MRGIGDFAALPRPASPLDRARQRAGAGLFTPQGAGNLPFSD